ncbi:MAG: DUF4124 domain-containing protein, partial [Gammaproteobacteria bacterium]
MCEHRHTCRAHRGAVATAGRAGAHLRRATGGAARVPAALRRCLSLPAVPLRPEDSVMAVRTCRLVSRPLLGCLVLAGITLAGGLVRAAPSQSSRQGIAYRWVDENGVVHYGDHIPPQYAAQDRAVLNAQGVEVRHFDAQKSPEQAAADARERATQIRQRQHDAFLITTYTSVKDIEALRDGRLEQLKGQRTAAQQYVDSLRTRLASLQTRALTFRPYNPHTDARRMPDDLAENLVRTVNDLNVQTHNLDAKTAEETALRDQFQADIERYRALHT